MRVIVYHVEGHDPDEPESYIYLYEYKCGHTPHEPYEEFDSLHDALKANKNATILRYPGVDF